LGPRRLDYRGRGAGGGREKRRGGERRGGRGGWGKRKGQ